MSYESTTAVRVYAVNASGTYGTTTLVTQNTPITFAASDTVQIMFRVPITGWSSNIQMSSDTDTRVCAARVARSTTQSISNSTNTTVIFSNVLNDTHAAFNSTTGQYLAPVSGYYSVSACVDWAASATNARTLLVLVGGSTFTILNYVNAPSGATSCIQSGTAVVYANAGQTIEVQVNQTSGGALNIGANTNNGYCWAGIKRETGPSVVASTETIACSYGLTSSQAVLINAVLKFDTKIVDTHNAYSTTTGLFTAPVSGVYELSGSFNMNATGGAYIKKGSTAVAYLGTASANSYASGNVLVSMNAGETLGLYTDVAATYAATTGNGYVNKMNIKKVGN